MPYPRAKIRACLRGHLALKVKSSVDAPGRSIDVAGEAYGDRDVIEVTIAESASERHASMSAGTASLVRYRRRAGIRTIPGQGIALA